MIVGILALVVLLVGVVWHKIGRPVPWKITPNTSGGTNVVPFDLMSTNTSTMARSSIGTTSINSSGTNSSGDIHSQLNMGPLQTTDIESAKSIEMDPLKIAKRS